MYVKMVIVLVLSFPAGLPEINYTNFQKNEAAITTIRVGRKRASTTVKKSFVD